MIRNLFQGLSLVTLLILLSYSASFNQTLTTQRGKSTTISRFENMTQREKIEYAKTLLLKSGLTELGLPDIVISERQPSEGFYGEYNSPSESPSYTKPTIVLFPAAFKSDGQLEVALRHEMMHFSIEKSGPPTA